MGIVVCICMLLGLSILQPTPWNSSERIQHAPKFVSFTALALLILGLWNTIYGGLNISGFWMWVSLISGLDMVMASCYVFSEKSAEVNNTALRKAVVVILALSFLVYAVTLIQLNLGYPILR